MVGPVHGRMPVILHRDDSNLWLDPTATPDELDALLGPFPAELMEGYALGRADNKPSLDGQERVEPA